MAVIDVTGSDLTISIDGVPFGCANSFTLNMDTEMVSRSCQATGKWVGNKPKRNSWSVDVDSLLRIATAGDVATNVTADDLAKRWAAQDSLDVVIANTAIGGNIYTGTGYIQTGSISGGTEEDGGASFSIVGDEELVITAVVAP